MAEPNSTDIGGLYQCVDRALDLFKRTYHKSTLVGGGWYHRLESDTPGPSATAVGLHSFLLFNRIPDHLSDGLAFLKARQVVAEDPKTCGGWAVNTSAGRPVLEATSIVARFLGSTRVIIGEDVPNAVEARKWIVANQNSDGGWGSFYGQPSRIWLTAMAIRALVELNFHDPAVTSAVDWLLRNRDPGGVAWGERPAMQATVTHTAFVLSALVESRLATSDQGIMEAIRRGYDWLQSGLRTDSIYDDAARVESYNVDYIANGQAITWQNAVWHHGLPFALSALVRHPDGVGTRLLSESIETIGSSQLSDGRWPNVDGTAGMSVWSVWPFLDALSDVVRYSPIRQGDLITWPTPDTIIIRRGPDRLHSLRRVLRRGRGPLWRRRVRRYWASLLLGLVLLGGAASALGNLLDWKEFGLALAVPVFLLLIQELIARTRRSSRS
jgi:hypothetical protein